MIKFLDLHAQYLSIKSEIDSAIAAVIRDSAFVGGAYGSKSGGKIEPLVVALARKARRLTGDL